MKSIQTTILAVSHDADLLGAAHALLTSLGYQVTCSSLMDQTSALTRLHRPDVVVVDAREDSLGTEQLRELDAVVQVLGTRVIVWHDTTSGAALARLLDAGADDIVDPTAWGELLSRLQAVARLREFEERLIQESGIDPTTHLLKENVFHDVLRARWEAGDTTGCLHVAVDHLVTHRQHLGTDAFEQVLLLAAEVFQQLSPRPIAVTGDGTGSYQVLVASDADCHQTAEQLRAAFEQVSLQVLGGLPLTVSCGICLKADASDADEMLRSALESARLACQRGGNCVVNEEQRRTFDSQWRQLSDPELLFASTTAKHLMTPFAWQLRSDESLRRAASLFEQTALDYLPVVDDNGFVSLLLRDQVNEDLSRQVREVCPETWPQVTPDTAFPDVLESLLSGACCVVVTNGLQALGLIRAQDLAVMDQLPAWTEVDPSLVGTDRLVVS